MVITIAGGGSTFTAGIVKSIALRREELEVDEIRLFDINKERQDKVAVVVDWVLHKELDPDDDELTRTRKVRRNFIAEKYKVLIDALYEGKGNQYIETEVKFEDGRRGKVSADLKIIDVKTFPIAKKAA